METATEPQPEFRLRCNIFVEGMPETKIEQGKNWLSLDLGKTTIFFESRTHFKTFVRKLVEEAAKL